ncbi:glycosyltransferase [Paracoccaceae bacterium]|nr:glycosyltransferase [Paracoccaceae bacterium]
MKYNKVYLSISFYGPNSKCGISRYAGMLVSVCKSDPPASAMYSIEPTENGNSKISDIKTKYPQKFILKKWTLVSIIRKLILLRPNRTVAHFHFPPTKSSLAYLFAPLIFRLVGFQVYQTWHEELSRMGWIKALILRIATSEIFVVKEDFQERTAAASRWVLKFFDIKYVGTAPLQVLENKNQIDSGEIIKSLGLETYSNIFLVFGFIYRKRNIELIIENIDPKSEVLVIAGDYNVDPSYYKSLKRLIAKRQLQDKVKFLGFVTNENLSILIKKATCIIFTNHGGVYNWNTSFLLSCYSSRPVIYLFDVKRGKPKLPGFTETKLDFGLSECQSELLRSRMDEVKKISTGYNRKLDINEIWSQIYHSHNFNLNGS